MARRSDHTRQELSDLILNTSWKIVGKEGFEALTARHLATEIGYTPGTIYNFFKSMDDLYLQVNARTLDILYDTLSSPACSQPNVPLTENMKKMANLYMEFARKHRPYWLMLFNHRLPEGSKPENWYQEKIDRLFEPLESLLQDVFPVRNVKERKMAARVLWGSVHGLCFLQETGKVELVDSATKTSQTATHYLIETFMAGIKR